MSCSQPFELIDKRYILTKHPLLYRYQIPCGWCLNCRKDRQNYFADRAKYEYKKRLTASFVTFTYDDNHLLSECLPSDFFSLPNGFPQCTLRYDHLHKFIDSLRHYIKEHLEIQNVLCQPDFSYMYVGEYGDQFKDSRPHFHILFFGLDFAYCKKMFMSRWTKGLIDVLPLLNGGIEYVTKYMDKQLFGLQAFEAYDMKGIARPRLHCSVGFGKGLLNDNIDSIKKNNYTYDIGRSRRRPISQYWRSLLNGKDLFHSTFDFKKSVDQVKSKMKIYNLKDYSKASRDKFTRSQSLLREEKIYKSLLNNGVPALDIRNYYAHYYGSVKPVNIHRLSVQALRAWSDVYRDSLVIGG